MVEVDKIEFYWSVRCFVFEHKIMSELKIAINARVQEVYRQKMKQS